MTTREFGSTGLKVSEVGFGGARLGGIFGGGSKDGAADVLRAALDQGITFFDTADMYAQGESEAIVGRAFRGKRDRVIIASKGGYTLPGQRQLIARIKPLVRPLLHALKVKRQALPQAVKGTVGQNFDPQYIESALHASLRRLNTDYLDVYQLHSPPLGVIEGERFADTIATLDKLKAQGKIRFYGVATDTVEDAVASLRYPGVSSVMTPFGLLNPEALDALVPQAERQGVAIIARGCYGGGLLSKAAQKQPAQDDPNWHKAAAFQQIAEQHGRSLLEMALQFSLSVPQVSVTLLGMRTGEHLSTNLRHYAAPRLSPAEYADLVASAPASK